RGGAARRGGLRALDAGDARPDGGELPDRAGAPRQLRALADEQRGAQRVGAAAILDRRPGGRAVLGPQLLEAARLARDVGARGPRRAEDLRVLVRQPLEELEP